MKTIPSLSLRCESSSIILLDIDARYYDPVIGRFYSNDPISFRDVHSLNRYAYANNNPYKYTDPDGNNPKLIADFALNVALNYVTTGQVNLLGAARETISGALNPLKTLKTAKKLAAAISKSSTLKPGKFAKESIPARGKTRSFRKGERDKMNEIGKESGCYICGSKEAGTKSGNFILDHQPANALTPPGGSQRLFPHCKTCSGKQAGEVTQVKRKLKED